MSSIDYYKVFHHTVQTGSFSKAAEQLYMTQPSVSYVIKQLEEQMGVRLFMRKSKGVIPTAEGKVLFHFVEQAFSLLQSGERKVAEMRSLTSGTIRLGASDSLCKHFLLPFLVPFRQKYPDIRIILSHGKSEEITKRLTEGQIDCGIIYLPTESSGSPMCIQTTKKIQQCFIVSPDFPHSNELTHSPVSLQALADYPFVMMSAQSRSRQHFQTLMSSHGIMVTPDIELGSVDLLIEFVKKGLGISLITKEFAAEELVNGELTEIQVLEEIPEREIGVVTLGEALQSIAATLFVKELSLFLDKTSVN